LDQPAKPQIIQGEAEIIGFEARYAETRGDILLAQDGMRSNRAYQALAAIDQASAIVNAGH
jgi:hypothetical protein